MTEKPAGYHEHHRRKGDRQTEVRGCDVIYVPPLLHDWIEKHPEEARQLGFSVSRYEDPADVPIVIPEEILKPERKKRERKAEKPRNRVNVTINVPKDEREDGAGILDDLISQCRDVVAPMLGLEDDCPAYFVLVPVLNDWLTGQQSIADQEEEDFLQEAGDAGL